MIRPPLEVADIIRSHGSAFVVGHHRWLTVLHLKVLRALVACRTAALGGHVEQCDSCGQRPISYNSCFESALSQVPGGSSPALVGEALCRTVARPLLSRCVHPASPLGSPSSAE